MDTTLGYPTITPEQRRLRARMELGLIIGGTLGFAAITLLRVNDRHKEANLLTFFGLIIGGVVGTVRVAQSYPDM